jgi:hypothetical protein
LKLHIIGDYNIQHVGWLKPKALTRPHGNSKVKPPKAIIVINGKNQKLLIDKAVEIEK